MEKKIDESGETQISLTDPDSRMMPVSGGRRTDVCYTILAQGNVQICVDEKYKLIPDHEVTYAVTDRDLLSHMAKRVKDFLGVDELEVLADMGYYHGKEIKACLDAGITPLIPKSKTSASLKLGLFAKDDFRYDPERDCYWCQQERSCPSASRPPKRTERSSITPPAPAPDVLSRHNVLAIRAAVASPAGCMKMYWTRCKVGSQQTGKR